MKNMLPGLLLVSVALYGAESEDLSFVQENVLGYPVVQFSVGEGDGGSVIVTPNNMPNNSHYRTLTVIGKKPSMHLLGQNFSVNIVVPSGATCKDVTIIYARTHDLLKGYQPFTTCADLLWIHPLDPMRTASSNPQIPHDACVGNMLDCLHGSENKIYLS